MGVRCRVVVDRESKMIAAGEHRKSSIRDKMNTRSIRCTDISVSSSDFIPGKNIVFPLRIFFVFSVLARVELQPAAMKSKLLS